MRNHFLIKPFLQLKHLVLILGALLISMGIGYVFLESTLSSYLRLQPLSEIEWSTLRITLRWGFFFILLIMVGVISIEHILFFHSIVGPIHVIETALKRMGHGDFNEPIKLRDSDQLKELADTVEDLRKKLKLKSEK